MPVLEDHELLTEFARSKSDEAFAALVERYVNLVYSTAIRFTSNRNHAEEIAQAVFIVLANKAGSLSPSVILSGWLYQATRLTAANFVKGEIRRQRREQEAYMQSESNDTDPLAWEQLAPLLDEAMGSLSEDDRNAVVLRFFENKTASEIAARLEISEAATHKRVSRALEKLRAALARRGVTMSAAMIAGAVSANSVLVAPTTLAAAISAAAVHGTGAATSTLTLAKGALKIMAWTKAKTAATAGLVFLLISGGAALAVKTALTHRMDNYPGIQGAWEGTIAIPQANSTLRVVFNFTRTNQNYSGTMESVDQGMKGIPVTTVVYKYPGIKLEAKTIGGTFDGLLNTNAGTISGKWAQGGMNFPLTLKRSASTGQATVAAATYDYSTRADSDVQGLWRGSLDVKGISLRLIFKIAEPTKGQFHVVMDSVDQGAKNVPATSAEYASPALNVHFAGIGASYEGEVSSNHKEITGNWTQLGNSTPLTLKRFEAADEAVVETTKSYVWADDSELQGHWKGTLKIKDVKLRLAFDIAKLGNQKLDCTLTSVDQTDAKIPATIASWTAPHARLEWKAINGSFNGEIKNGKLVGTWQQGPITSPLTLERAAGE